jgi:hypothetical protein
MEDTNVFELTDEQLEMVTGGAGAETQSLAALPWLFKYFGWVKHLPIDNIDGYPHCLKHPEDCKISYT